MCLFFRHFLVIIRHGFTVQGSSDLDQMQVQKINPRLRELNAVNNVYIPFLLVDILNRDILDLVVCQDLDTLVNCSQRTGGIKNGTFKADKVSIL